MELQDYFASHQGKGILATADSKGNVDLAIFAKPHFMDDECIAFIMPDKLIHQNLKSNPNAAYMFIEDGEHYQGKRLFLNKIKEERDTELLYSIRRKCGFDEKQGRYLVFFKISKVLPLIGAGEKV